MCQNFVLHDACVVPDIDILDSDGRDLGYHDSSQCIGDRCVDADKVELNSRWSQSLYRDNEILRLALSLDWLTSLNFCKFQEWSSPG